jgi:hypothetical protein
VGALTVQLVFLGWIMSDANLVADLLFASRGGYLKSSNIERMF